MALSKIKLKKTGTILRCIVIMLVILTFFISYFTLSISYFTNMIISLNFLLLFVCLLPLMLPNLERLIYYVKPGTDHSKTRWINVLKRLNKLFEQLRWKGTCFTIVVSNCLILTLFNKQNYSPTGRGIFFMVTVSLMYYLLFLTEKDNTKDEKEILKLLIEIGIGIAAIAIVVPLISPRVAITPGVGVYADYKDNNFYLTQNVEISVEPPLFPFLKPDWSCKKLRLGDDTYIRPIKDLTNIIRVDNNNASKTINICTDNIDGWEYSKSTISTRMTSSKEIDLDISPRDITTFKRYGNNLSLWIYTHEFSITNNEVYPIKIEELTPLFFTLSETANDTLSRLQTKCGVKFMIPIENMTLTELYEKKFGPSVVVGYMINTKVNEQGNTILIYKLEKELEIPARQAVKLSLNIETYPFCED